MAAVVKVRHADRVNRLLTQFRASPRLQGLVKAFLEEFQDLEDTALAIIEQRDIDAAVGTQLDRIGEILVWPRDGQSDVDYRVSLKGRVIALRASGTLPEIIALIDLLYPTTTINLAELYPAKLMVDWLWPPLDNAGAKRFGRFLDAATAVGVGVYLYYWTASPSQMFQFDGPTPGEIAYGEEVYGEGPWGGLHGLGFSDTAQSIGGRLAGELLL
jgi:hypothetical protein